MTEAELIADFPLLYHMAEGGSWPQIQDRGLLSTTELLDVYGYSGKHRRSIEQSHRPESVELEAEGLPRAVVRDQKPMSDGGLIRALPAEVSPEEWYKLLNTKTFFWTSENRLHRLLKAGPYRDFSHDVLTVDTARLVERHAEQIRLCPINSGCTKPYPHKRDRTAFLPIIDYPYDQWKKKRAKWDAVVEVAVEGGVPEVSECVVEVREMRGTEVIRTIWPKPYPDSR